MSTSSLWRCALVASLLTPLAGCTLDNQEAPALGGPSGFALSLAMTASPNQLPRDGQSESVVTLRVRGADGQALAGQRLTLSLTAGAPDGSSLSATDVTSDANGTVVFSVTAPRSGSIGDVTVLATPFGSDASNSRGQTISIAALPQNSTAPTSVAISFSPTAPERNQSVSFTGQANDEGVSCTNQCTFNWSFGDGDTASGRTVSHTFTAAGSYSVRLTVTDAAGSTTSATQTVTVSAILLPTATFTPTTAVTNAQTTFTATATASGSHRIVRYTWNWGDGSSTDETVNPTINHTFTAAGPYSVSVTVTDDLGQTKTTTQTVTVAP